MRVNANPPTAAAGRSRVESAPVAARPNHPSRDGRPPAPGTKLAKIMRERHIRVHQVGSVLCVSDRTVYNYLTRQRPIPALQLGALCDRLDMDPEQLVDGDRFLLECPTSE